ncbi:MAG: DUF4872 domain-containing protein [Anaerolineae bacterium]
MDNKQIEGMPESAKLDLGQIVTDWAAQGITLSQEMVLGLGAGLYFEYISQPGRSPSRFFSGHNRRLERDLEQRLQDWRDGDKRGAITGALRANALAMDLDRSHYTAIMGMELLAEDFETWERAADAQACALHAAEEIDRTESLYRRPYVRFLQQATAWQSDAAELVPVLADVASEWDVLGQILRGVANGDHDRSFAHASLVIRRIAMLEEHFWGEVINRT